MKKYLKLILHLSQMSWMLAMEYRLNFFAWLLVNGGWAIVDVISIYAIATFAGGIGPWNPPQIIFMTGLYRLISVIIWGWLYNAFERIPRFVSEGGLDMLLTKPIDSQFLISNNGFSPSNIASLIVSIVYISVGAVGGRWNPGLNDILFGLRVFNVSLILTYALYFASVACSLFVGRLNNIHNLFPNAFGASRYPPEIYPPLLKTFLTWILPLALMLTVPMQVLWGKINWDFVLGLHVLTIIFLALGRRLWQTGLRRYSSVSS